VHDDQFVLDGVVKPFVDTGRLPEGVKVHANGVGRRNDDTGDDVVALQQGSSNWFTNAINVVQQPLDETCCETRRRESQRGRRHIHATAS
jgi:hypothetical protein